MGSAIASTKMCQKWRRIYRPLEQHRWAWSLLVAIAILTPTLALAACGGTGSGSSEAQQRVNEGVEAQEAGRLDDAVALYTEAIALDRKLYLAYFHRSKAYGELGRFVEALSDASLAVEHAPGPDRVRAYTHRSKAYFDMGELGNAVLNASKAIELDGSFAAAYANRGLAYREQGKLEQAMADLEQALSLTDDPALAAQIEGMIEELRGQAIPTPSPEPTPEPTPEQ